MRQRVLLVAEDMVSAPGSRALHSSGCAVELASDEKRLGVPEVRQIPGDAFSPRG